MEAKIIDAFGLQCPKPLVLAKKELDAGVTDLAVQVDNETAVKNLTRLGSKKGMAVSVDAIEGGWLISFAPGDGMQATDIAIPQAAPAGAVCGPNGCGYAVFVNHDAVGEGDPQLGRNLVKMALYTLSEADEVPSSLLFMNGGVKLIAGPDAEQQCVDNVAALQEEGDRGARVRHVPQFLRHRRRPQGRRGVQHVRYPRAHARGRQGHHAVSAPDA